MMRFLDSDKRFVYPVNPNLHEVLGIEAYSSVIDIPDPIDLAVIAVSAQQVPKILQECVLKRVGAVNIISAGFAETDEKGQILEDELITISQQGGLRFIGPNSMGYLDTSSNLSTMAWIKELKQGPVAVISQSGNYGEQIVYTGLAQGIGFSKFISSGNEADLHMEDYLEYLAQDEDTKIIVAYIEGLREGRRFLQLAKETTVRKPIIVIKSGRTEGAQRAARSHTGALTGSDRVYSGAFKQAGVIRVTDEGELCDIAIALLNQPLPRGNRVGILTIGGGLGVVATEACESSGLEIMQLSSTTIDKLNSYLSSRWSHANPVDIAGTGGANRDAVYSSLWVLMEDDNIDAILLQTPVLFGIDRLTSIIGVNKKEALDYQATQKERLKMVRQRANECGKPVFLVTAVADSDAYSFLQGEGIPIYTSPYRAAKVLQHLYWYNKFLNNSTEE
jgi:acetyltransferase